MNGDPLPSWSDEHVKAAILDFVARVTKEGGPDFVPAPARIAAFDNDGTLWCEQPLQVQIFFAFDRLGDLAAKDPSLRERQPFKAFLERDMKTIASLGKQGAFEVAYDREFRLSPLAEALDRAGEYGITVVSVKRDWRTVFGEAGIAAEGSYRSRP